MSRHKKLLRTLPLLGAFLSLWSCGGGACTLDSDCADLTLVCIDQQCVEPATPDSSTGDRDSGSPIDGGPMNDSGPDAGAIDSGTIDAGAACHDLGETHWLARHTSGCANLVDGATLTLMVPQRPDAGLDAGGGDGGPPTLVCDFMGTTFDGAELTFSLATNTIQGRVVLADPVGPLLCGGSVAFNLLTFDCGACTFEMVPFNL